MNDARRVCSNIRMITYCEVHRFTFSLLFGISVYVCWKGLTGVPGIVESSYEQSIITESPFFASKFPSFLYMLSRQTQQINFTGGCGCSICPWWGRTQRRRYQIEHIFCRHTCLMLPLWSMSKNSICSLPSYMSDVAFLEHEYFSIPLCCHAERI